MDAARASRYEFREWAAAYYFGIEGLHEVVTLMVDDLDIPAAPGRGKRN
jgi:hypothetical protein